MTARLAQINRHPIKGHGREALASVRLLAGACLPWDRHWAVAHEAARLQPGWNRCVNFARAAKAPQLMAITSTLDEPQAKVTLRHPALGEISIRPDDPADLPRFLDWVGPLNPPDRAQPVRFYKADRGLTDSASQTLSILSMASLADLSVRVGKALSPARFRGNLWIDGLEPWTEFDWIGRHLRIGEVVFRIEERIGRCSATTVDPETGNSDADTLSALSTAFGHQDFGVFGLVVQAGTVSVGDRWEVT